MSIKYTQYDSKCYCNSVASPCCSNSQKAGSGSVHSVVSKRDKQSSNVRTVAKHKQKTDFVKIKPKTTVPIDGSKNRRGLGHSNLHGVTDFSRRNSAATTVTFSTPCTTPVSIHSSNVTTPTFKTPSPQPRLFSTTNTISKNFPVTMSTLGDNFSALSISTQSDRGSDCGDASLHEYTEQRRYYESAKQLIKLISTQGDNANALNLISGVGGGVAVAAGVGHAEVDAEHLRRLQEFRLQNAEDCFTIHRQLDLHLPMREKKHDGVHQLIGKPPPDILSAMHSRAVDSVAKIAAVKKSTKKPQSASVTPYAMRQRLLQLRLEAEELKRAKPGRKLYGPLEKSCALRYQETY